MELLDGKNGNWIYVSDGNGNGMRMGMKSLKWDGFGTKNLFPHISTLKDSDGFEQDVDSA